jgi:Domain of unknown function (DUF4337)
MTEAEELREHSEHAKNPFDKQVAATMAILAAGLAVVSVLGHIATTEELLSQQKASDQWAYYQAKNIRRYQSEVARDLFAGMKLADKSQEYQGNADKYRKDDDAIQKEAGALEQESHMRGQQALRLHLGEVFLEISIVFASLAILTKRTFVYWAAVAGGVAGVAIASTTALIAG